MKWDERTAEELAGELAVRLYFCSVDQDADPELLGMAEALVPKVETLTRVAEAAKRVNEVMNTGCPQPEDDDSLDELNAALAAWRRGR